MLKAMKINILEARNQLSKLIQSALDGEEVVIANRGNPVVRIDEQRDSWE